MPIEYLLGIDIGTQGTKTTLLSKKGEAVSESRIASKLISPTAGTMEENPDDIFSSVLNTIRQSVELAGVSPRDIVAIGIDGQMAGIMGIDGDFEAVTPLDSWLDVRCGKYIGRLRPFEKEINQLSGGPVTYNHGPKIIWWKNEHPDVYKKIRKFVLPHVYVAGKLAGIKSDSAYMDYTNLHFTGFADNYKKVWSKQLLSDFDISSDKMAEIVEPWKIIGGLKKNYADYCGLLEGTKIAAGCGDQAATSLGAGIGKAGLVCDVAGTASVFSASVNEYRPDIKNNALFQMRSVVDGLWIPLGHITGGGLNIRWFKDEFTGKPEPVPYEILEAEATDLPAGSEGLVFVPHLSGRACPNNPYVRGSFIGLNWKHQRGHLFKAVMEGIAYDYKFFLSIIKEAFADVAFDCVHAVGGGAKSMLFCQIKSDVLGIPYMPLKNADTATLGSAIVAAYGVGLFSSLTDALHDLVTQNNIIEPDMQKNKEYERYYGAYIKTIDALGNIYKGIIDNGQCFIY